MTVPAQCSQRVVMQVPRLVSDEADNLRFVVRVGHTSSDHVGGSDEPIPIVLK